MLKCLREYNKCTLGNANKENMRTHENSRKKTAFGTHTYTQTHTPNMRKSHYFKIFSSNETDKNSNLYEFNKTSSAYITWKPITWQTYSQLHVPPLIVESISSKSRKNTRILTLASFVQHSIGSPRHSNQTRKRIKRNPNWKGRNKMLLLAQDMIQYIESSKDTKKKK